MTRKKKAFSLWFISYTSISIHVISTIVYIKYILTMACCPVGLISSTYRVLRLVISGLDSWSSLNFFEFFFSIVGCLFYCEDYVQHYCIWLTSVLPRFDPFSGPLTELEKWKRRQKLLTSVTDQLKSKDCKGVIAILITAKSKVLKRWKAIDGRYSVYSFCLIQIITYSVYCTLGERLPTLR